MKRGHRRQNLLNEESYSETICTVMCIHCEALETHDIALGTIDNEYVPQEMIELNAT